MKRPLRHWHMSGFFVALLFAAISVAQSQSVTYTYDEAGRLKATSFSNGASTSYSLDAAGNRKSVQAVPPLTLPGTPGTPAFSSITTTSAHMAWSAATGTVTAYAYSVNAGTWTNVGTALSVNLSSLVAGTNYAVQVRASNASGNGTASSAAFPTLPPSPGVPTFASITSTTATVNWTAAAGVVSSYAYSVNGGSYISVGTALTVNLTSLAAGISYTVNVQATNASGSGAASVGSFTTTSSLPSTPGAPSFSSITATNATATWTAASGTVTSYSYSVNSGAWVNVGTALTANLSGLTAGTTYTVQVRANNSAGNGPASSASFPTLPPPPGAPTFSNVTGTAATANWTAASGVVTSYAYSVNGGAYTNVGTARSANLTGLAIGTTYTVSVLAVNASGNGTASSATLTTVALPGAPGTPTFSNVIVTTATVSWNAALGTVSGYSYSLNGGVLISVGNALSTNLAGLTAGTTYSVQVYASNAAGNGPSSSPASFTTSSTYSDTPAVTVGAPMGLGPYTAGFLSASFGSISPTTTTNGYTYTSLYDKWSGGMAQSYAFSALSLNGFSADPTKSWLTSVSCLGVTYTGASASYTYSAGTATWTFQVDYNGFGFFGDTRPASCTVIHK